jgi:hypothetical protein
VNAGVIIPRDWLAENRHRTDSIIRSVAGCLQFLDLDPVLRPASLIGLVAELKSVGFGTT